MLSLLGQAGLSREYVGRIGLPAEMEAESLGDYSDFPRLASVFQLDEVIICTENVAIDQITRWMEKLGRQVEFRTVGPASLSIVGSPSRDMPGELYTVGERFDLASRRYRRSKRILDLMLASAILLFWPLVLFLQQGWGMIKNAMRVFIGQLTWVGYAVPAAGNRRLPVLPPAVLPQGEGETKLTYSEYQRLNELYARRYSTQRDLRIIRSSWRRLGQQPGNDIEPAPADTVISGAKETKHVEPVK